MVNLFWTASIKKFLSTHLLGRNHQTVLFPSSTIGSSLPNLLEHIVPLLSLSEPNDDIFERKLGIVVQYVQERVDPVVERGRGGSGEIGSVAFYHVRSLLLSRGKGGKGDENGRNEGSEREHCREVSWFDYVEVIYKCV